MPRSPRFVQAGDLVHITDRGVNKTPIFRCDADRRRFMLLAREEFGSSDSRLLSYCLMDTHFHFLILAGTRLSSQMHRLLFRYAQYFNEAYGRVGHLFQGRFSTTLVRTLTHALNAVAYIHLNPVEAGMVRTVADWPWSSHDELISGRGPFVAFDSIEAAFGMTRTELVEHYLRLVQSASDDTASTLEEMMAREATRSGLDPTGFTKKAREQSIMDAKRRIVQRARARGFTLQEIADGLHCSRTAAFKLGLLT